MVRFFSIFFAAIALFVFAPDAHASQVCENIETGRTVYSDGSWDPIYEKRCTWKYGAIAIDAATRKFSSAWNYDLIREAEQFVVNDCGKQCIFISFSADMAYIALSEENAVYGISEESSKNAILQCNRMGGINCQLVLTGSSTNGADYWTFGAIAYDPITGKSDAAWGGLKRSDVVAGAVAQCTNPLCGSYVFQRGHGALAMSADGKFFNGWSALGEQEAGKEAVKACQKLKGKKPCSLVKTGSSRVEPLFTHKPVKLIGTPVALTPQAQPVQVAPAQAQVARAQVQPESTPKPTPPARSAQGSPTVCNVFPIAMLKNFRNEFPAIECVWSKELGTSGGAITGGFAGIQSAKNVNAYKKYQDIQQQLVSTSGKEKDVTVRDQNGIINCDKSRMVVLRTKGVPTQSNFTALCDGLGISFITIGAEFTTDDMSKFGQIIHMLVGDHLKAKQ